MDLPAGGTVSTSSTGCLADAARLYGDAATWFRASKGRHQPDLYVPQLVKDQRLVTAVKAWSRCMRQTGHRYAWPDEIREDLDGLTQGMSAGRAHATEVEAGHGRGHLLEGRPRWAPPRALEREYRATKLQDYSDQLATYQRMKLAALARAQSITAPRDGTPDQHRTTRADGLLRFCGTTADVTPHRMKRANRHAQTARDACCSGPLRAWGCSSLRRVHRPTTGPATTTTRRQCTATCTPTTTWSATGCSGLHLRAGIPTGATATAPSEEQTPTTRRPS